MYSNRRGNNRGLALLALLLCWSWSVAFSQGEGKHFKIRYVINIADIDTTFVDNNERIKEMEEFLRKVRDDDRLELRAVRFSGTASPDGPYEFNQWLCANRLEHFKELIRTVIDVPDSIVTASDGYITWDEFRQEVEKSDLKYRDEILAVIDQKPGLVLWYADRHTDHRLLKLRRMHGGKAWESLKSPILFNLRFADAEFVLARKIEMPDAIRLFPNLPPAPPPATLGDYYLEPDIWIGRLHLKTNFVDLGLLIANLAVEVDLAPHWSFTLPLYYSAIDYFKSTVKFRMLGCQPEFRYWFSPTTNDGFFAGAHLGVSYYNFAFDGPYRYQDHNGTTPTVGGGLSFGYRTLLGKSQRWRLEFTAGAGVYPLYYDRFHNTPDVRDGMLVDNHRKTFVGLDQAAVTLAYSFDIRRKIKWNMKGGRP